MITCKAKTDPLIRVGIDDGDVRGADNRAIQLAVSALPPSGGTVEILPGVYTCTDAVHLKSNVHLVGCGENWCVSWCRFVLNDYAKLHVPREQTLHLL